MVPELGLGRPGPVQPEPLEEAVPLGRLVENLRGERFAAPGEGRLDTLDEGGADTLPAPHRVDVEPPERSDREIGVGEADDLPLVRGDEHERVVVLDARGEVVPVELRLDDGLDLFWAQRVRRLEGPLGHPPDRLAVVAGRRPQIGGRHRSPSVGRA